MARRRPTHSKNGKTSGSETTTEKSKGGVTTPEGPNDKKEPQEPTPRNDPEWYAKDPNLLRDAASIPFSLPFGAGIPFNEKRLTTDDYGTGSITGHFQDSAAISANNRGQAGICTLYLKTSIGTNLAFNDPANVAANSLYSYIRSRNSGRKNYDPADAFMYMLAFADIYAMVFWAQRLYNYAFMYSQRNYYIGKDLLYANGVNADDIIHNLAQFRYELNAFINKVSSFAVPNNIEYFKRRAFLFANYYLENQYGNIKDQLYQLAPGSVYKFTLDRRGLGCLKSLAVIDGVNMDGQYSLYLSMRQIMNKLETMLGDLPADEDFGIISGDILKAFEGNIIGLSPIPEDGGLVPVYDPWVLSQFKNASIVPVVPNHDDGTIVADAYYAYVLPGGDDPEYVSYGNVYQSASGLIVSEERALNSTDATYPPTGITKYCLEPKVLSTENPDPGVGDVIEGSRLMCYMRDPSDNFKRWCLSCGTEIVTKVGITITDRDPQEGTGSKKIYFLKSNVTIVPTGDGDNPYVANISLVYALMATFKYAPQVLLGTYEDINNNRLLTSYFCVSDLDNVALVHYDPLRRLHETALLSLFFVPGVAKLM